MWSTRLSTSRASNARLSPARPSHVARAGFDDFKDAVAAFYEKTKFEAWAPKSSRAWRLRQYPSEVVSKRDAEGELPITRAWLTITAGMPGPGLSQRHLVACQRLIGAAPGALSVCL